MIMISKRWKEFFRGAYIGALILKNVTNTTKTSALDALQKKTENDLRSMFANYTRDSLKNLPTMKVYVDYYRRFKKSYHVLLQLESVVLNGKSLPKAPALVQVMFIAELKNLLLTAGHDLQALKMPLKIDVSTGNERYTLLSGKDQVLKPGDMFLADGEGVVSSVIYGPDKRTRLKPETGDVLFVVYVPPGLNTQLVYEHLNDIKLSIMCFSSDINVEFLSVLGGP